MNSIRFAHRISRFTPFDASPQNNAFYHKNIPPKKSTRTQLRVTDTHESDDTLQAAASTAERATPTVLLEHEIDDDDDDDVYDNLGGQRNEDSRIDTDTGDLRSQITDEDRLDLATQNRLMLEMLLENEAQWKAEQKLERERMAAERERMAAERDQWAVEWAEQAERSIAGP
jgi:hypothetical protein